MAISGSQRLQLNVVRYMAEAKGVAVLELRDPQGRALPDFEPGSHLEVYLTNGLIRHYSLLNDNQASDRYVIAVGLSPESLGGSSYIHRQIREGDTIEVSSPCNNFPLQKEAEGYCFIAGGIGITPILSMIRWCIRHKKPWRLFYTSRSRQRAAFYEELRDLETADTPVVFHFNDEHAGCFIEFSQIAQSLGSDEHVYCCGPDPLMQNVKKAMGSHPDKKVHFEWFSAPTLPLADAPSEESSSAPESGLTIILKGSGQKISVSEDQSILEALEGQGIEAPYSCRAGICRTCETEVCTGIPDHRDLILSDEEKESGKTILICVSRAKSDMLEINL